METWIYVAIIGGIAATFIGSAKFYFQFRIAKLKENRVIENKQESFEGKIKGLLRDLPKNRETLLAMRNEMASKGATVEQLKPIDDKLNLINKVEPYKEIIELISPALGGVVKRFGIKL